jgi:hypothetical protein
MPTILTFQHTRALNNRTQYEQPSLRHTALHSSILRKEGICQSWTTKINTSLAKSTSLTKVASLNTSNVQQTSETFLRRVATCEYVKRNKKYLL